MSLSSLLRWGGKRKAPDERRDEGRYVAEGPMKAYWVADGACVVARGELRDLSEDGSGLGFRLRREMPVGRSGWVVTTARRLAESSVTATHKTASVESAFS